MSASRTASFVPRIALVALVSLCAAVGAAASTDDAVVLLRADDEAYLALDLATAIRSDLTAPLRLIVVREGTVVADHGLADRDVPDVVRGVDGGLLRRERQLADSAWVSEDGRAAVVLRSNVTVERPVGSRPDETVDAARVQRARARLTWYDPDHPEGRWDRTFAAGRWIGSMRLIDPGTAVAVLVRDAGAAEFLVLDPDGRILGRRDDVVPSNPVIRATPDGRVLAADLPLAPRAGGPERALFVVDVARGRAWSYPWTYGSDEEPTSWAFEDDGTLVVQTALAVYRYAPDGQPRMRRRPR